MTTVKTFWAPQRLDAAIASSFGPSVQAAEQEAKARLHNTSKSDVTGRVLSSERAVLTPEGLAGLFERGRRGGYEITAKAGVMPIGQGRFAARVTAGPMRSYPAMGPAARDWALGGYQSIARRILAASGFRVR